MALAETEPDTLGQPVGLPLGDPDAEKLPLTVEDCDALSQPELLPLKDAAAEKERLPEGEGEGVAEAQGDDEVVVTPVVDTAGLDEGLPLAEPLTVLLPAEEGELLGDCEVDTVPLMVKLGEEDKVPHPDTDSVALAETEPDTLGQPVGLPLGDSDKTDDGDSDCETVREPVKVKLALPLATPDIEDVTDWLGQGEAVTLDDAEPVPPRLAVLHDDTEADALPETAAVGDWAEVGEPSCVVEGEPVEEKNALPLAAPEGDEVDDWEGQEEELALGQGQALGDRLTGALAVPSPLAENSDEIEALPLAEWAVVGVIKGEKEPKVLAEDEPLWLTLTLPLIAVDGEDVALALAQGLWERLKRGLLDTETE